MKGYYNGINTRDADKGNSENIRVRCTDENVVIHIGYYESVLNAKEVNELIKILKEAKKHRVSKRSEW